MKKLALILAAGSMTLPLAMPAQAAELPRPAPTAFAGFETGSLPVIQIAEHGKRRGHRIYDDRGRYYEPRRLSRRDRIWRDGDRYYCRRDNGTTGLVIGAGEHPRPDQVGYAVGRDRGVAHPPALGLDLDERFAPEHAPGAVAPDGDPLDVCEGRGDLVGADGAGRGVLRHPDGGHRDHPDSAAARSSAVTRPRRRPSTLALGPSAQLPKQKTSRTSTSSRPAKRSCAAV